MSVKYIPVQWNPNKWFYDAIMLAGVFGFLWVFLYLTPDVLDHERAINPQIHNARAFGACAFTMLTVILCIGPLARLDTRFLPLLYNRRHFGVMTAFVAATHGGYILDWYFAFSSRPPVQGLLEANTSFNQIAGFPFEIPGAFGLLCLTLLAATSHDFWLKFLTPPIWKRLHYLIYAAYAAVVGHVVLGILQDDRGLGVNVLFLGGAAVVCGLHVAAWLKERSEPVASEKDDWVDAGEATGFREGFARIIKLPSNTRVAIFLHEGKLSAIANSCAHQNGPLGEGRIIDCVVTCPWHGFQYDVRSGASPAPFTEKVPTYNLRLRNGVVEVDPTPNAPGTYVDPVALPTGATDPNSEVPA